MNRLSLAISIGALSASLPSAVEAQCAPQKPTATFSSPVAGNLGWFGMAVAVSDEVAVVGAAREGLSSSERGSAYVYELSASGWGAGRRLEISDAQRGERFGSAVAIIGDEILVGAPFRRDGTAWVGGVYVFRRDYPSATWREVELLLPGSWSYLYGTALAHDGERLVVGTGFAVVVNERDPASGRWEVTQTLLPSGPALGYGNAFDIDGDTIVVGARHAETAFVYERDPASSIWSEVAVLTPPQSNGEFGERVAVSGKTILVAAPSHNRITVFTRDPGGAWIETQSISPPAAVAWFGKALAFDGEMVVAGGVSPMVKGAVWIFGLDPATGLMSKTGRINASTPGISAGFGRSLDLSGARLVVGEFGSERAHVYDELTVLSPTPYCTSGTFAIGCTPRLSFSGNPSASEGKGFRLRVEKLEGGSTGWVIFGPNGRQALPWEGSGWLCVKPPVAATPPKTSGAKAGKCFGALEVDLNAHWAARPETNPGGGVTVQAQYLARGPSGDLVASEAIQFLVCP